MGGKTAGLTYIVPSGMPLSLPLNILVTEIAIIPLDERLCWPGPAHRDTIQLESLRDAARRCGLYVGSEVGVEQGCVPKLCVAVASVRVGTWANHNGGFSCCRLAKRRSAAKAEGGASHRRAYQTYCPHLLSKHLGILGLMWGIQGRHEEVGDL
jgi:hypothetical protein